MQTPVPNIENRLVLIGGAAWHPWNGTSPMDRLSLLRCSNGRWGFGPKAHGHCHFGSMLLKIGKWICCAKSVSTFFENFHIGSGETLPDGTGVRA